MPLLATGPLAGRLPLGLRVLDANRVLGRRNAAVGAGLRDLLLTAFQLGNLGFQPHNLLIFADKIAAQDIIDKTLFVQLLRQLRGIKVLGEAHVPEELLTPSSEFHPVSFKALAKPGVKVLFHTTKVGKRFDICKFNKLSINALRAICGLCSESEGALFGGPDAKFLKGCKRPQNGINRLIFSDLMASIAA